MGNPIYIKQQPALKTEYRNVRRVNVRTNDSPDEQKFLSPHRTVAKETAISVKDRSSSFHVSERGRIETVDWISSQIGAAERERKDLMLKLQEGPAQLRERDEEEERVSGVVSGTF